MPPPSPRSQRWVHSHINAIRNAEVRQRNVHQTKARLLQRAEHFHRSAGMSLAEAQALCELLDHRYGHAGSTEDPAQGTPAALPPLQPDGLPAAPSEHSGAAIAQLPSPHVSGGEITHPAQMAAARTSPPCPAGISAVPSASRLLGQFSPLQGGLSSSSFGRRTHRADVAPRDGAGDRSSASDRRSGGGDHPYEPGSEGCGGQGSADSPPAGSGPATCGPPAEWDATPPWSTAGAQWEAIAEADPVQSAAAFTAAALALQMLGSRSVSRRRLRWKQAAESSMAPLTRSGGGALGRRPAVGPQ